MLLVLGALTCLSAFALEPFERINNVKILRVLEENIILVNRGLEDGLSKNDHVKFSTDVEGFSSRAICVKSQASTSYWKLYRIPRPETITKDYSYSIVGMADKEIPFPTAELRDQDQKIKDTIADKKRDDTSPDPFQVRPDLPEKLTERDLIHATTPEKRKLFVEKVLDQDLIKRDLSQYRMSVYASPFTRQSINSGESMRYGFRGANVASKYRLLTQFEQQRSKMKDPLTGESVSTSGTTAQAQFIVSRLKKDVSSLALINYNSQYFSRLGTPKSHWQFGPIGFTWHLYESKTWEYMDLSYVPLYDVRHSDTVDVNGVNGSNSTTGLRHGFRYAMKTKINDKVAFENVLWVRPYQNLTNWKIESDNLNLVNDLKLIFNLTENLFFDYNFVFQRDKLWATLSRLPETNSINSINFRYDFDL